MRKILIMLCLITLVGACSIKKQREEKGMVFAEKVFDIWKDFTKGQLEDQNSEIVINRTKLPDTYKMAVYFIEPEDRNQNWRWGRNEKNEILSTLEKKKKASQVFELINTTGKNNDLKALRYMAAQQGAEALLLIRGMAKVETDMNVKALSYIVLVPMLFVEGNTVNSTFVSQAVLWDVKSPFIHFGVETEGNWSMDRPLVFRQKDRAIEKSKEEALDSLSQKLEKKLQTQI
jgi:hypothetical protein